MAKQTCGKQKQVKQAEKRKNRKKIKFMSQSICILIVLKSIKKLLHQTLHGFPSQAQMVFDIKILAA